MISARHPLDDVIADARCPPATDAATGGGSVPTVAAAARPPF